MLDNKGFDLWAEDYDTTVGLSDESEEYPFAGYKVLLNRIFQEVLNKEKPTVLDIGFGTGTLTTKLYEKGATIWGQDFSREMVDIAQAKMPQASFYQGDFSKELHQDIRAEKFDAIIATYSLHHLDAEEKKRFIEGLGPLLKEGGQILIGDVAFERNEDMERCRKYSGEAWDEEEFYFVEEEMRGLFPKIKFEKISFCAGIFILEKEG